jgi:hypothetical protein
VVFIFTGESIMNMELQQPENLISLATSAVLVSVDVNVWSATKQDRGISDEVTASKHAVQSAGRYVKNLLADHPKHKALVNYRQTIYNWVKRRTYRWNNSQDLLPSIDVPKFKQEYHEHEAAFRSLLVEFLADYDNIVSDMAFKQGGMGDMFNRNDYPDKAELASKFGVRLYVAEVPTNDFRCNIAKDIADDLFESYKTQAEEIVAHVMVEQQTRFVDVMKSISHCCGVEETGVDDNTGETKTKKRKIYDTTIQKAKEMCETFKGFNLSGSEELEEARASLEKALDGVDATSIRESDAIRSAVKDDVDSILSKFGSFQCV